MTEIITLKQICEELKIDPREHPLLNHNKRAT